MRHPESGVLIIYSQALVLVFAFVGEKVFALDLVLAFSYIVLSLDD